MWIYKRMANKDSTFCFTSQKMTHTVYQMGQLMIFTSWTNKLPICIYFLMEKVHATESIQRHRQHTANVRTSLPQPVWVTNTGNPCLSQPGLLP